MRFNVLDDFFRDCRTAVFGRCNAARVAEYAIFPSEADFDPR